MSESCKKLIKSSRKHCFLEISCKRKLLEQLLKIEISDVFENSEKWLLRRPERSLSEPEKLCYECWIQSWNCVFKISVFRSEEWLVSFHDPKHMEFSLFWKKTMFFVDSESFVSTRRFSISSKQPILGYFELRFRSWKNFSPGNKIIEFEGGVITTSHMENFRCPPREISDDFVENLENARCSEWS